ncbi:MAG: alpha/beta hydrolase [Spirochaetales bacterium]|nr:alpha/beta hydrolase [Spirochaetales bacterium]
MILLLSLQAEGQRTFPESRGIAFARDQLRIYFTAGGTGERALIFIHGWTCNRTNWAFQMKSFAPQYRVVSIDLGGHGESDQDRSAYSIPGFGADVVAVLELLDIRRAVLVAHSMGGSVALEAATQAPDRIVSIVGVDNFKDRGFRFTEKQIQEFNRPLEEEHYETSIREMSRRMFHPGTDRRLVQRIVEEMAQTPQSVAVAAFTAANRYTSEGLDGALGRLKRPLYLINSDRSPTQAHKFRPLVAEFHPRIMRATGHFPMLEKPQEFDRELRSILNELDF